MKVYYTSKTHALIIQSLDGQLFVNINDTVHGLEDIKTREEFSKDFDDVPDIPRQRKYIPSMNLPWRIGTFEAYLQEQKHRNNGAQVGLST